MLTAADYDDNLAHLASTSTDTGSRQTNLQARESSEHREQQRIFSKLTSPSAYIFELEPQQQQTSNMAVTGIFGNRQPQLTANFTSMMVLVFATVVLSVLVVACALMLRACLNTRREHQRRRRQSDYYSDVLVPLHKRVYEIQIEEGCIGPLNDRGDSNLVPVLKPPLIKIRRDSAMPKLDAGGEINPSKLLRQKLAKTLGNSAPPPVHL